MAGTLKLIAPTAYLGSSVANIYTPAASTIFTVIRHIHLANVTTSSQTFTLYVGATGGSAGGTELFKLVTIPANSYLDYYPQLRLASTDFLTGLASAASSVTITVEGEFGVV